MTLKLNGSTDGSVSIDAPADTSPTGTDITLTLPTTVGSANQFVKNGGTAGELEYSSMVEDSTGVGIGTSSPSSYYANKLVVDTGSSAQSGITIVSDSSNQGMFAFADGTSGSDRFRGFLNYNHSDNSLGFGTDGSERIRINRFGGLNVGSDKLGVNTGNGNITVDDGIYISAYDGDYQIRGNSSGSGSATLYIGNAAIQVSSDRRLKENIVDTVVDAAEELKRVRVVDFTWNDPSDMSFNNRNARGTWTGLIAQELIDVFPFAVNAPRTEEDLSIDQDSEKRWLVDQDQLVPVLIKGFQQALARIETLETQNTAQQAQIDDLLARVTALEAAE